MSEPVISVGDCFETLSGMPGKYMLCLVTSTSVCLINMTDGNRWVDPVDVSQGLIFEKEFGLVVLNKFWPEICGHRTFTPISRERVGEECF